jgi:hypothetical protein
MKYFTSLFIAFVLSVNVFTQTKLVVFNKTEAWNAATDSMLIVKLREYNIDLVFSVDFRKKCDYTFSEVDSIGKKTILKIKDCNEKVLGEKILGESFDELSNADKVVVLSYSISDIIKNPGEYILGLGNTTNNQNKVSENTTQTDLNGVVENPMPIINHHSSRYFFTPTAYNLEKGELYYNTMYLAVHDVQYGINDHFSIGMGTTVAGYPFYLTPKATIYRGKRTALAVGDLFMVGTWGNSFIGNIAYCSFTIGDTYKNISFGAGHFHISGGNFNASNKPVFNVACMLKLSDYFYFISENYFTWYKEKLSHDIVAWVDDPADSNPSVGWYEVTNTEYFDRNSSVTFGITGIRFINRNKNIVSYQAGVAYLYMNFGDIPASFKAEYQKVDGLLVIPMISFTKKFGNKF